MESVTDTVSIEPDKLEEIHDDLSKADEKIVHKLVEAVIGRFEFVIYMDDIEVHTIDRKDDSKVHSEKEVMSGDATVTLIQYANEGDGEMRLTHDIQYEVYAGTHKDVDGFVYDPIEVTVFLKD